jgi:hypothetical protein
MERHSLEPPRNFVFQYGKEATIETQAAAQSTTTEQQHDQNTNVAISGSYSDNFRPHPECWTQPSQDTTDGTTTPINEAINPSPASYRGVIHDMGDNLIRTLTISLRLLTVLRNWTEMKMKLNTSVMKEV